MYRRVAAMGRLGLDHGHVEGSLPLIKGPQCSQIGFIA